MSEGEPVEACSHAWVYLFVSQACILASRRVSRQTLRQTTCSDAAVCGEGLRGLLSLEQGAGQGQSHPHGLASAASHAQ